MYFDADQYGKHTGHEYENILLSVQALATFYSEQNNTLHVDWAGCEGEGQLNSLLKI